MGIFRSIVDRLAIRTLGRNEYESVALRRYFDRQYGIKVGLYSIGAFDRWRVPPGTVIGRYCSIAKSARLLDANHPTDALSTHPYFYLKDFGLVDEDQAEPRPPVIEDDVWLGHGCTIAPSCHRIGRGAIIGAGAVVMSDVSPYAIMVGAPAKLARYRFPAELIEALEASQWWLLDKDELARALKQAPGFALHPSRDAAQAFLAATGRLGALPAAKSPRAAEAAASRPTPGSGLDAARGRIMGVLQQEIAGFTPADIARPFQDLEIDSFGLINLRIAVEKLLGMQISDRVWGQIETPGDLLNVAGAPTTTPQAAEPADGAPRPQRVAASPEPLAQMARPGGEQRLQYVNMPQMALSGLSEAWVFKEIGDLHWSVLTRGLRTPSAAVSDSEGDRLYATFTRICLTSDAPLTDFAENERLTLDLDMSRYGAGMFFSAAAVTGACGTVRAQVMTSFSKFGEAGANTSLRKGQPVIPQDCDIPPLTELPAFAQSYRAQRAAALTPPLFSCEYEIVPPHDINGVGLLYFAAYPIIVDVCAMRRAGGTLFSQFSTIHRDVFYFANSTPDETLIFQVHRWDETEAAIAFDASLSRKSDGKLMAFITTTKQRIAAPAMAASAGAPQAAMLSAMATS